jgi:hypothetical protein
VTSRNGKLGSVAMAQMERDEMDQQEGLVEMADRMYRELDEELAGLAEKRAKEPPELPPGFQEMIDTHEEYFARMNAKLKWLVENAPF